MSNPQKNSGLNADQMQKVVEENYGKVEKFWEDPRKIMNLVDLLFLWEDEADKRKVYPS